MQMRGADFAWLLIHATKWMVEEIITTLSRIRWLFVIARNSTFT